VKKTVFLLLLCSISLFAQDTEKKFSLYYENDQYELTPQHYALLDSILLIDKKSLVDVHIRGYTNSVGGELYNLELSRKRAENVKELLKEFTIISSNGYGELGSEAANNRRVDILVHNKTDHIPEIGEIVEEPVSEAIKTTTIATYTQPKKGDKITLEGIRFYADRDVIMDESKEALEELLAFVESNPKMRFRLIGHICCGDWNNPGLDVKNMRTGKNNLSEARAQAVHNYLVKKGIDSKRIRYIGMAYRYPTGKGDRFDRRVEIEITSID
tara:strand:- start:21088 stop:21900 length:813 start_codon:yes stop_codon:yes gene_type:complete